MDKELRLLELAEKRKNIIYSGYSAIGDFDNGIWECDYVSPYSLSAHNVNSDVLIILQDWDSSDSFTGKVCPITLKLGYAPSSKTNINLINLLSVHLGLSLGQTYATNLFPYIKPGKVNAAIPARDLKRAAEDFTLPMISIIQPKLVICLGLVTFNAIRKAYKLSVFYLMDQAIKGNFTIGQLHIFCQAHPSQQGQNNRNRGGVNRVESDWSRMKSYL